MPLINIALVLIIAGVLLWLVNTYIPMAGAVKAILNIVVVVALSVWVLQSMGLIDDISGFRVVK